MPPGKSDAAYLWDMLDAARAVADFVTGRSFASYEDAHPEIPWRPIIAQRHVLAHDYGEIKHERLWRVATAHIPELIVLLEPLVPDPSAGE